MAAKPPAEELLKPPSFAKLHAQQMQSAATLAKFEADIMEPIDALMKSDTVKELITRLQDARTRLPTNHHVGHSGDAFVNVAKNLMDVLKHQLDRTTKVQEEAVAAQAAADTAP